MQCRVFITVGGEVAGRGAVILDDKVHIAVVKTHEFEVDAASGHPIIRFDRACRSGILTLQSSERNKSVTDSFGATDSEAIESGDFYDTAITYGFNPIQMARYGLASPSYQIEATKAGRAAQSAWMPSDDVTIEYGTVDSQDVFRPFAADDVMYDAHSLPRPPRPAAAEGMPPGFVAGWDVKAYEQPLVYRWGNRAPVLTGLKQWVGPSFR